MVYVAVGVALFLWGAVVGLVGRKAGIVLAIVPVLVWFDLLGWFGLSDSLDTPAADALPAYLVIGLLAFLFGSNITDRTAATRMARRER